MPRRLVLALLVWASAAQHVWDIGREPTNANAKAGWNGGEHPKSLRQEKEASEFEHQVLREDGASVAPEQHLRREHPIVAPEQHLQREHPITPMVAPQPERSTPEHASASDAQEATTAAANGNVPLWLLKMKMGEGAPRWHQSACSPGADTWFGAGR